VHAGVMIRNEGVWVSYFEGLRMCGMVAEYSQLRGSQ